MGNDAYERILRRLAEIHHYDTSKLIKTIQKQEPDMKLKQYFENREGKSVLSSANADGMVTAAIYSKPHVFDDGTVAFVMRKRLTYENLKAKSK